MNISIIIPVFNVEQYVSQCIDSVMCQTYYDIEVILINDGSTDKSIEICSKYDAAYSNIRLINKENGGLSDARNCGIFNATGDYIMFLDSDDYWETDFLHELAGYINQNENLDYIFLNINYITNEAIFISNRNIMSTEKSL